MTPMVALETTGGGRFEAIHCVVLQDYRPTL